MPLVAAKCTQCGAELEVDNSQEAAVCKFCGTPFIVEKAINNYTVTNKNYINAQQVIVTGNETADNLAEAGEKHLMMHNYKNAEECFTRLEKDFPSDYRGPRGMVLIWTHNFDKDYLVNDYEQWISKKYQKFSALAPQDERTNFTRKLNSYYKSFDIAKEITNTKNEIVNVQKTMELAIGVIDKDKLNSEYIVSFLPIPIGLIIAISIIIGASSLGGKIIGALVVSALSAGAFFLLQYRFIQMINGKRVEVRHCKRSIQDLNEKANQLRLDYDKTVEDLL